MKRLILSEEFKRMQKLAGIINEEETPNTITIEPTDKFRSNSGIEKREITMNNGDYYYVKTMGTTGQPEFYFLKYENGLIFGLSYRMDQDAPQQQKDLFKQKLSQSGVISNNIVKDLEKFSKNIPYFTTEFENGLSSGSEDKKGYFKIK